MVEVLGVVSAAAQLATLCSSSLRMINKMKSAGPTLQRYQIQFEELRLLSKSISDTPLLQTGEVEEATKCLLILTSGLNLCRILEKNRILRGWYLFSRKQELVNSIIAIEQQKHTLSFVIRQVQNNTLYKMSQDIRDMKDCKFYIPYGETTSETEAMSTLPPKNLGSGIGLALEKQITCGQTDGIGPATEVYRMPYEDHDAASRVGCERTCSITDVSCSPGADQSVVAHFAGTASELSRMRNSTMIRDVRHCGRGNQIIGFHGIYDGQFTETIDVGNFMGNIDGAYHEGGMTESGKRSEQRIGFSISRRQ
ncbi:hypothetical protein PWT90_10604 [Aphanocladium album]|nr:hypothetical protein PWT90_10604 [Aphanocladium album]